MKLNKSFRKGRLNKNSFLGIAIRLLLILVVMVIVIMPNTLPSLANSGQKKIKKHSNQKAKEKADKDVQKAKQRKPPPKLLFHGIVYLDEESRDELEKKLVTALNLACLDKELAEFYKKIDVYFVLTTDIARLAKERGLPIPNILGISETDSLYFAVKSEKDEIVRFIVLDQQVFNSQMRLLVSISHESIHAKHFLNETAKEDFLDEEIQTYEENIRVLEALYENFELEVKVPDMARELKHLISKERSSLNLHKADKVLKNLRK